MYELITLDDSIQRLVVEFSEDIEVAVSEYEEPGKIQVAIKTRKEKPQKKEAYFFRTKSAMMNEELMFFYDETLIEHEQKEIQKDEKGKFVIQFGPFKTESQALQKLKELPNDIIKEKGIYVEKRKVGERP
ncbi:hypothetical protein [Bacillus sp. JJ722]|uniref:hypothetical protein n=1 Tax=Bacillus sp. JJ722 TaxID=3122973 RepID=UPI002FFE5927